MGAPADDVVAFFPGLPNRAGAKLMPSVSSIKPPPLPRRPVPARSGRNPGRGQGRRRLLPGLMAAGQWAIRGTRVPPSRESPFLPGRTSTPSRTGSSGGVAVVGGEEDEGIVEDVQLLEFRDQPADHLVEVGDASVAVFLPAQAHVPFLRQFGEGLVEVLEVAVVGAGEGFLEDLLFGLWIVRVWAGRDMDQLAGVVGKERPFLAGPALQEVAEEIDGDVLGILAAHPGGLVRGVAFERDLPFVEALGRLATGGWLSSLSIPSLPKTITSGAQKR